jgi:heme A synthase
MKKAYRVIAYLIALGVALQASFIAFGMFGFAHALDSGAVVDESYLEHNGNAGWVLHDIGGSCIEALALALLIVSFFAKVPGGKKWALIIIGVVFLQVALAFAAFVAPGFGMLHGINALVLFTTAIYTARRANRREPAMPEPELTAAP